MNRLNIPDIANDKSNKFDRVAFVNSMTNHSLKILIKRVWENFQDLATKLDDNRSDVSNVIDQILSGGKWSDKNIVGKLSHFTHNGEIIQYNSSTNTFKVISVDDNITMVVKERPAMTREQVTIMLKQNHIIDTL